MQSKDPCLYIQSAAECVPGCKAGFAAATQIIVERRPEQAGCHSLGQQGVTPHLPSVQRPCLHVHLQAACIPTYGTHSNLTADFYKN